MARCWRVDNHKHDDRNPSLGLDTRKDRWRCFVCDGRSASTVDLVMGVRGCTVTEALRKMMEHFTAPTDLTGTTCRPAIGKRWISMSIVASGLWASSTAAQRAILGVLWAHRASDGTVASLGYDKILQLSGLRKRKTIAEATRFFEAVRLLDVELVPTSDETSTGSCTMKDLSELKQGSLTRFRNATASLPENLGTVEVPQHDLS